MSTSHSNSSTCSSMVASTLAQKTVPLLRLRGLFSKVFIVVVIAIVVVVVVLHIFFIIDIGDVSLLC